MAALKPSRNVQYPLHQEFTFNIGDTMTAVDASVNNILAVAGSKVYEAINLPAGAVVTGGSLVVETASNDATTATVSVGDSGNAARYLGATSIKAAGVTNLVPTGFRGAGENLRITVANGSGGATTGKVTVRLAYVLPGRAHEVQPI